jgi:hypothetical protein
MRSVTHLNQHSTFHTDIDIRYHDISQDNIMISPRNTSDITKKANKGSNKTDKYGSPVAGPQSTAAPMLGVPAPAA